MSSLKGYGHTFDTVSYEYDKFRPGYAGEVYDSIFEYVNVDHTSKVLEIGSGSGQATAPVLDRGCFFTSVEPGKNFAEILTGKFGNNERFSIVNEKFEDVVLKENTYDLVYAATSFHWIEEKAGYEKVFSILKEGGAFARFRNHPFVSKEDPLLAERTDDIYDEYYNKYYNIKRTPRTEYSVNQAKELAFVAEKYGFSDIKYHLFHRKRVFTSDEYISLLGTYSDHIAIREDIRHEFFAKIKDAIDDSGGMITISDTIDLQLARK